MTALFRIVLIALLITSGLAVGVNVFPFITAWNAQQAVGTATAMLDDLHQLARQPAAPGTDNTAIGGATLTYDGTSLKLYQGMPISISTSQGNAPFVFRYGRNPSMKVVLFVDSARVSPPWALVENPQGVVMPVSGSVSAGSLGSTFPNVCTSLAIGSFSQTTLSTPPPDDPTVDCATGAIDPNFNTK